MTLPFYSHVSSYSVQIKSIRCVQHIIKCHSRVIFHSSHTCFCHKEM